MIRLFFDVHEGEDRHLDDEGLVVSSVKAAEREALWSALEIAASRRETGDVAVHVRDEQGAVVIVARVGASLLRSA